MLKNLLKYDLKWIYKVIVVFYIFALFFSILGRLLISIPNSLILNVFGKISLGFAVGMMISSLINCLMRSWARFIRNIYKDESYLTHTLPISKKTIYLSKVLSSIICTFTTVIVIVISLFICYYSDANIELLKESLEIAATVYNTTVLKLLLIIFFMLFVEIVFIILIGYVGIIIGHKSNQHKIIKSITIAFALYLGTQLLTLAIIYVVGLFNSNIMNLINTTYITNIDAIKWLMYLATLIYLVYTIFYYILGRRIFETGVDVD